MNKSFWKFNYLLENNYILTPNLFLNIAHKTAFFFKEIHSSIEISHFSLIELYLAGFDCCSFSNCWERSKAIFIVRVKY